jgi:hypothetical protein
MNRSGQRQTRFAAAGAAHDRVVAEALSDQQNDFWPARHASEGIAIYRYRLRNENGRRLSQ